MPKSLSSKPLGASGDHRRPRLLVWSLISGLLAVCAGFPLLQAGMDFFVRGESPGIFRLFSSAPTHARLQRWDQEMRDRGFLTREVRPRVLEARYSLFGELPAGVLAGAGGWLFYADGVRAQWAPGPNSPRRRDRVARDTLAHGRFWNLRDPATALALLHADLAERGIEWIVAPLPGKAWLYPERLVPGAGMSDSTPARVSVAEWRAHGWTVVDLYSAFAAAKAEGGDELFLRTDTHWSPAGVRLAAESFAKVLRAKLDLPPAEMASRYRREPTPVLRRGDLTEMTGLRAREAVWPSETVSVERIVDRETGLPYRDDPQSPVLWLGDSFSRIYQTDAPGAGGVIAQVGCQLGMGLTSLVQDGGAAVEVRRRLLARPELLRGKRVVVWAFAEREWALRPEAWTPVPLPPP